MEEKIGFRQIWHSAGVPGVILAVICVAADLIKYYVGTASFPGSAFVIFIADFGKITGCVLLLRKFMMQFKAEFPEASKRDLRRYGKWVSILTAFIFAGAMMIFYDHHPEISQATYKMVSQVYADSLDANSMKMMEDMLVKHFNRFAFASIFICYSFIGWVISAILSSHIRIDEQ